MRFLEDAIARAVDWLGRLLAALLLLMTCNVAWDVLMRYAFHRSSVGMQEMEWHLFAVVFLCGIPVTLLDDGHVRIDILYDRLRPRTRALINIIGTLLALIPFALLICLGSVEFVRDAWESHEISQDPGGLPLRWLIKAVIPLSFALLVLAGGGHVLRNIRIYREAGR